MKPNQILIAILAGAALMTACKKDDVPPSEKDAVVQISVRDQKGTPINGTPVLIYDEEGYAKFQKEHNTPPLDVAITRADGNVEYRFAYDKWLTSGKRTVTFVVYKEQDEKNYDIWAETRTLMPSKSERVEIRIELGEKEEPKPGTDPKPEPGAGEERQLEMYDTDNGRTLLDGTLFLDTKHYFDGGDIHMIADAGEVADLKALGEPVFTEIEDLVAATPGHGYFICRNMTFKTFPSGAHALAIGAEYTKVYVAGWLQQGDKKVGVRLHYQTAQAGTGTLPERGHTYEMSLKGEHTLDVELPEAPELYEFVAHDKTQLELAGTRNRITVRVTDTDIAEGREYLFHVRSGVLYTDLKVKIVA